MASSLRQAPSDFDEVTALEAIQGGVSVKDIYVKFVPMPTFH